MPLASQPIRRAAAVLSAGAAAALGGCGADDERPATAGGRQPAELPAHYVVPGDRVFPEGIGAEKSTGSFFVSSSKDGTIYRGDLRRPNLEVFLLGGQDGRTEASAVRVNDGRLWVAGRSTERLFVYDLESRRLLRTYQAPRAAQSFSPGAERSLLNGITFAGDAAYVTDSYQPVIHRIGLEGDRLGQLEPWLDLRNTPIAYARGSNLKGITVSDGEEYLVTVNSRSGKLFRIGIRTKEVREIDLGGADVRTGDGTLLDGTTLLVVRGKPGEIQPVFLSKELLTGRLGKPFGRADLRYPTSMFELNGRGIVVNSQLDRGRDPELPFTIAAVPIPKGTLPQR